MTKKKQINKGTHFKESIPCDDATKTFLFKMPNEDVLKIDYLEYNEERMLPNCWVVELINKKDFDSCFDSATLNKIPIWGKDEPITIHIESDLR